MRKVLAVAMGAILSAGSVHAAAQGHYVNGVEGIKAATLPPPGIYWRMYNVYYHADTLRDDAGDKLDVDFKLKIFANVNRVIWMTPLEVLGGNFFMDALVPIQYTDIKIGAAGVKDDKLGLGDPCVEPLGISWHGGRYDAAIAAAVYLPVGEYDQDDAASPGLDMWTFMLTAGGTYYMDPEKTWAASILSRFETHTYKDDLDIRPGNDFHFEYGLSKTIMRTLDIGLAGYCHWQVSDDKGGDVTWDGSDRDRVFAIGPELNYFIPQHVLFISLRGEMEFEARDRTEGWLGALTLTKGF